MASVFVHLLEFEDIMLQGNIKPDQLVTLVSDCNTVLLVMTQPLFHLLRLQCHVTGNDTTIVLFALTAMQYYR